MLKKMEKMTGLKNKLIDIACREMDECGGFECPQDVEMMGEVVDMIKDLAEAEKSCMEACYYESVVTAMARAEQHDMYGYNPSRSASTGRYTRMGYVPMEPHMAGESGMGWEGGIQGLTDRNFRGGFAIEPRGYEDRMGYDADGGRMAHEGGDGGAGGRQGGAGRQGYTDGRQAPTGAGHTGRDAQGRYGYTREEGLENTVKSMEQMWKDADPQLKARLKSDIEDMLDEK